MDQYRAFTTRFNAQVRVLTCKVKISLPYAPNIDVGKAPPILKECIAIWDTGASCSLITKRLANKLGLIATGIEPVTNTGGTENRSTYFVNLYLPNLVHIPYLKIVDCEDVLGGGEMLIGMDVIGAGDFAVTHEDGKTIMSYVYPPIDTIDFITQADRKNVEIRKMQILTKTRGVRMSHQDRKKIKAKRKKEKARKKLGRKRK